MSKPVLRPHASKEIALQVGAILLDAVTLSRDAFPSCLNCVYFDEANAYCSGHKANPPPRVIVEGCAQYVDKDAIPF